MKPNFRTLSYGKVSKNPMKKSVLSKDHPFIHGGVFAGAGSLWPRSLHNFTHSAQTDPVISCWLQTKQLLILSLHGLIDYDQYYNLLLGNQLSSQGLNMIAYFCLVI
jgi:hypothetical protein